MHQYSSGYIRLQFTSLFAHAVCLQLSKPLLCRPFASDPRATSKPACAAGSSSVASLSTHRNQSFLPGFLSEQNHPPPIAQLGNLRGMSFSAFCLARQHPACCRQTPLVSVHLRGPSEAKRSPPHPPVHTNEAAFSSISCFLSL